MTSTATAPRSSSHEDSLRSAARACPVYSGVQPLNLVASNKDHDYSVTSPRCCDDPSCDSSNHGFGTPSTDGSHSPGYFTTMFPDVPITRVRSNSSPGSMPLRYTHRQSPLRSLSILPEDDMMSRSTPGLGSSSTTDEDSDEGESNMSRSVGGVPFLRVDTDSQLYRSYSLGSRGSGRHSSLPPTSGFGLMGSTSPPTGSFPLQYCSRKSPLRMSMDTPPVAPARGWRAEKEDDGVGLGFAVETPPLSPEVNRGQAGQAGGRTAGRR